MKDTRHSKQLLKDVYDFSKDYRVHKSTEWNVALAGLVEWPGEEEGEMDNNRGGGGGGGVDDDDDDDGEGEGVEVEEAEEDTNMAFNMVCYIIYESLWRIWSPHDMTNGMWDKG